MATGLALAESHVMKLSLYVLFIFLSWTAMAQSGPKALFILPGGLDGESEDTATIESSATQHKPVTITFDETRNETTGLSLKVRFGGHTYWIGHQYFKPVAMDLSAKVYTSPSEESTKLGALGRADLIDDVILTGRKKTGPGGAEDLWQEVIYLGKPGWVKASAFRSLPTSAAPEPSSVAKESPAHKSGPSCVSSSSEAMRSPRFRALMEHGSPFTTWTSNVGASVTISPDGQAVLHHPINGNLSAFVSLCLSASNTPYAVVNGGKYSQTVHFNGPEMSSFSLVDPESHNSYVFSRAAQ